MMAGLNVFGLWFFIILTGVSYSFPTKKDTQEVPSHGFTDTAVSSHAFQNAPQARSIHGGQMRPTPALYNSNAFAAPVYLAYNGIAPDSSFQGSPSEEQDAWAIQPPGPFSAGTSSQNLKFASGPEQLGLSYARPSVSRQSPFQSGESSLMEKVYDRGNYNSQTEEQGLQYPYGPIRRPTRYPVSSFLNLGPSVGGLWFGYPNAHMMMQAPIPSDWNPMGLKM